MLESKLERLRPRGLIRINNRTSSWFVDLLVFFYFLTLSGELLHVELGLFKPRVNHLISFLKKKKKETKK